VKKALTIFVLCIALIPSSAQATTPLVGMPPVTDPNDIYAADRPNNLSPVVKNFPKRVYVPNHTGNSITEIDPKTFKIGMTVSWKSLS